MGILSKLSMPISLYSAYKLFDPFSWQSRRWFFYYIIDTVDIGLYDTSHVKR